jgi:hypothetical protein
VLVLALVDKAVVPDKELGSEEEVGPAKVLDNEVEAVYGEDLESDEAEEVLLVKKLLQK